MASFDREDIRLAGGGTDGSGGGVAQISCANSRTLPPPDACWAVHVPNLAGGPLHSGRQAVTQSPPLQGLCPLTRNLCKTPPL